MRNDDDKKQCKGCSTMVSQYSRVCDECEKLEKESSEIEQAVGVLRTLANGIAASIVTGKP